MLPEAIFWIYVAGYFGWFAYGVWRFCRAPGDEIVQVALAVIWPIFVPVYLSYRAACWLEVRRENTQKVDRWTD